MAGDSNMLRIIQKSPNTINGHVISGGSLLSIQFSLAYNLPTEHVYFMAGTNDLLKFMKERYTPKSSKNKMRARLRNLMDSFKTKSINVTFLTIPPISKFSEKMPMSPECFNYFLKKAASFCNFDIIDAYSILNASIKNDICVMNNIHLNTKGSAIIRSAIENHFTGITLQ